MTHTASHGVFEHLARSVTERPCKELTDRAGQYKRTTNGLKRLIAAIERTPAEAPKRAKNYST